MNRLVLHYGNTPVPYTAAWSAEEHLLHLGRCPHARAVAICQGHARGQGRPMFGSPHMNRQREVIALGLCDLCARPLASRTKVSLSQARPQAHGASFGDILQVEPLLHRECAAISMKHCPALRTQANDGRLRVRQVFQSRCQFAVYSEQGTFEAVGERVKSISHAKVQLIRWQDRDADWLDAQ